MPRQERPFWEHLPELYHQDALLDGLVGLFEALYLGLEQEIDGLPERLYDPARTPDAFLDYVGRSVGLLNENGRFTPAQMRALLPVSISLHARKGTRGALRDLLRVYLETLCGEPLEPCIVEYDDWAWTTRAGTGAASRYYAALYGGPDEVTVLLPPQRELQSGEEQARLEELAQSFLPATATARVTVLRRQTALGRGGYLGCNTTLG